MPRDRTEPESPATPRARTVEVRKRNRTYAPNTVAVKGNLQPCRSSDGLDTPTRAGHRRGHSHGWTSADEDRPTLGRRLSMNLIGRLIAVVAGVSLLLWLAGPGRAQAPTRSFQLMEATIPDLQAALSAGAVTSRDLVTMYLARIDAYDQRGPALNAISAINDKALAEADALDAERKTRPLRGPLHGIPVIIKDNYETVTMPTADGSRSLAGWVAGTDAVLVRKLRDGGAIVIAKSNMHEFARGITTLGSLFGQT